MAAAVKDYSFITSRRFKEELRPRQRRPEAHLVRDEPFRQNCREARRPAPDLVIVETATVEAMGVLGFLG
ncbi:hypothetical protein V6N11_040818 [Hibiscus sabdariffa]|uniref:Uncharacterized protein n=1 Tax=Hibiscus sabdariffa TaxID=183260 RepID=A0ABR2RIK7_9ROSI